MSKAYVELASIQLFLNSRGGFIKSKKLLTKTILDAGAAQGYLVHLSAFENPPFKPAKIYHINQDNQITAPFISMSKACVEVALLQLF